MDWFKTLFVVVIVIRLDSTQNEVNETNQDITPILDDLDITTEISSDAEELKCVNKAFDLDAFGCRNQGNFTLNFKDISSLEENDFIIAKIKSIEEEKDCYEFYEFDGSFVASANKTQHFSFCKKYALLSKFSTALYYIDGPSVSKIQKQCPQKEKICVVDALVPSCPITNFTVTPLLNRSDTLSFINLHISWDKLDKEETVSIKILQKIGENYKTNCLQEMHELNLLLSQNNTIVKPNMVTEHEVQAGCTYEIVISSEWSQKNKILCTYNYTVPECVENKCDCDKFEPQPRILSVENISGNKFLVKWDPGKTTINNSSHTIKDIQFGYDFFGKGFDFYREPPKNLTNNLEEGSSEMKMKVFDGEKYTLTGTFKNNFSCTGKDQFRFTAPIQNSNSNNITIVVIISLCLVGVIGTLIYKEFPKYKNKILYFISPDRRRQSQNQELSRLNSGQGIVPMNTNIQYTPFEILDGTFDEFEFSKKNIILKEIIGSGAFGQVYSAKAIGIGGIEGYRMVAVKTLGNGEHVSRDDANDFIAEIEIFKKIGNHPNIVALLGCCTVEPPYMMIMEFVPCGDLKNYLVDLRQQWLKIRKIPQPRQFIFPDTSDGVYIEAPAPGTPVSITSSRLPSTTETVSTCLDDPLTPLLAHYTLDKVLDHNELQNFALQIARGMAHLEKILVTHRDLAARNILINEYKTLKISDFGLSRSGPYINHKTKKLPLRWMAIEAIVEQKYDSKSDVWSFGVVLWEIGTLGAFPYESVPDSFIQQFLQMGRRLERPEICTDELYSLMRQCWTTDPEKRPTFQELVDALDVKKRKIYVNFNQLNPTYVFPPSDIEKFVENPVRIVDIDI